MLELTVRLIASLAVVVGLLLLIARVVGRRFQGRDGAAVQVLHRQQLSRTASVAVLSVGSRVLVVGTTDQQVRLLTELDPEELDDHSLGLVQGGLLEDDELDELSYEDVVTALPRETVIGARGGSTTNRRAGAHRAVQTRRPAGQGSLAGSVLSPDTWKQAIAAATGGSSNKAS